MKETNIHPEWVTVRETFIGFYTILVTHYFKLFVFISNYLGMTMASKSGSGISGKKLMDLSLKSWS